MGYVNKKDALMNLSNPKDFDVFKNRFLKTYKDAVEKIVFIKNNQEELYNYISGINNISLNVGSQILFTDTKDILEKIKRGEVSPQDFDDLYITIRNVYQELELL
ncbi:MAG: hypothetical protein IJR67_00180 [Acholeplasmatales bacterium]|nr:hypothetical protein [Acholeplasmatales bacterium]